jgi:hypothetical protein
VKHPEILLLPLLGFVDYFLTVLGAIEREKEHARHFKMEQYELNPIWQKSINQRKWFNPRHALLIIAATGVLAVIFQFGDLPEGYIQLLLGTVFVVYGVIIARHLGNIFIFRYLARRPDRISGEITMSHQLVLRLSATNLAPVVVAAALIAIVSRNNFAWGGLLGVSILFCMHLVWMFKAARRKKPAFQLSH